MTTRRAAIYCRISQDREGAGLGVERQRADCQALADRLGWTVVAVHQDNDISATSGKPRPGYRALLADLDAGRANAVLVWHTDRLHRSPRELEEYVDLCERQKVTTQTVQTGELDLSTPSGRAVARMLGAMARFEVEHKSERIRRKQLQMAQDGRWLGGARPFGWTQRADGTAVLNRPEARELRRAADQVLAGSSLGSIVDDLNRRGVTTSTGGQWTYTSLRQVLRRPRNAGLSTFQGEIVGRSPWPVILTEDTWRSVLAVLDDPTRRRSASNKARWLLGGLARCGTCGERLRSSKTPRNRAKGTTRTAYRCSSRGPGHVARDATALDEYVTDIIVARLNRADVVDLLAADQPDTSELRTEAMALRARLAEAADLFAAGSITGAQLERITADVEQQLAAVEQTMAHTARGAVLGGLSGITRAKWARLPIDRRRVVVDTLVTVTVLPIGKAGSAFHPEAVRVDWK